MERGRRPSLGQPIVAVAIDRDRCSQFALKWATDHLIDNNRLVNLIHVKERPAPMHSTSGYSSSASDVTEEDREYKEQADAASKEVFAPFRCFCSRKDIQVEENLLEETDIVKGILSFINKNLVDVLVLGSTSKNGFVRFKGPDIPSQVQKQAPEFCTVYVISKAKVLVTRGGLNCPIGSTAPEHTKRHHQLTNQSSHISGNAGMPPSSALSARVSEEYKQPLSTWNRIPRGSEEQKQSRNSSEDGDIKSPFGRARTLEAASPYESDISFVGSARPSTERTSPFYGNFEYAFNQRNSNSPDTHHRSPGAQSGSKSPHDLGHAYNFSSSSGESRTSSWSSSLNMDDMEAEVRRLRTEIRQTVEMYVNAYKEAMAARNKFKELQHWKKQEERRIGEIRLNEEHALALAEEERTKCQYALKQASAARRLAEREQQKRISAELKARRESEEKKKAIDALGNTDVRYRIYTIDEIESATDYFLESRKIGEGGYGPVYKCYLDHTPVAVKVLRPDAAQGRSQFQQEVEVLSCIRHPNMVLLLGACPEYGCLVYEYMANGSLEDCLFRRGNSPALPWQLRFRIAAEIGTGLLFLHQTKPEPLVHRDLKPANILLDHNYVSKISDVGLARLVPPSVADNVTQYRMTSAAGTFCYIDPEYQQTGMLGIKSDVYSLGILLLQLITAKPAMGLAHHVEEAIEKGTIHQILDPAVTDWPLEEALQLAKLALQCAELRRKDRPDLGTGLLPTLNKLRALAEENMFSINLGNSPRAAPTSYSQFSVPMGKSSGTHTRDSGFDSKGSFSTDSFLSSSMGQGAN